MLSENYRENIRDFFGILRDHKIDFFPVCGSLLGAWRDKAPMQWDTDVDIGIYAKDRQKVEQILANSNTWHIYANWRKELAVIKYGYSSHESKIDIFFLEEENDKLCLYSYRKNSTTGIWDVEWRIKYAKEYFDKLIDYTSFLENLTIKVPERSEELLESQYPNFRVPNPDWDTYQTPLYDKEYREIAIIIPTIMRHDALQRLVESIKKTQDSHLYRIYIADQGNYDTSKEIYYQYLRNEGHKVFYVPFNCGLSYSRNQLVKATIEPYILILDDDFILTEKTQLDNFVRILIEDETIGVVGGDLERNASYHYNLKYMKDEGRLYYIHCNDRNLKQTTKTIVQKPVSYLYCDIVLNFSLFRREVFDNFCWDEKLKLVEHTDFFLRLQQETKWKVAHTTSVTAIHDQDRTNESYALLRSKINGEEYYQMFLKKWNLTKQNIVVLR